jgi:hypothetical protein
MCIGDIIIVVVESRGDPRDSQIERTIGLGDPGNRRRKDPVVCAARVATIGSENVARSRKGWELPSA